MGRKEIIILNNSICRKSRPTIDNRSKKRRRGRQGGAKREFFPQQSESESKSKFRKQYSAACEYRKGETKLDIPEVQNNQTTTKDETNQRSDISDKPHNSYLQQFVYCVLSIMDYTISFCILSSTIFKFLCFSNTESWLKVTDLTRKFYTRFFLSYLL